MPTSRRPLSAAAAIAALAPASSAPAVRDAEVRVGFTADNSLIAKAIALPGLEFWAHMTNFVASDLVIDARDGKTKNPGGEFAKRFGPSDIPAGVQYRPASYLSENAYMLIVAFACAEAQSTTWLGLLDGQVGEPYDKAGIADFIEDRTLDPNYRGTRHPWFCNELGIWALQTSGVMKRTMLPAYRRPPGGAADMCQVADNARVVAFKSAEVKGLLVAAGFDLSTIQEIPS